MIYARQDGGCGVPMTQRGSGCCVDSRGELLPADIKKATVSQLIRCLLEECGAHGMYAYEAMKLGARLAGKEGWKEVPLAAWARHVDSVNTGLGVQAACDEAYREAQEVRIKASQL